MLLEDIEYKTMQMFMDHIVFGLFIELSLYYLFLRKIDQQGGRSDVINTEQ